MDFTVAICTYNGASRLPRVLDRLQACCDFTLEQPAQKITWEILVVDNNSSDNTAEVVRDYQKNWAYSVPLKYCRQPQQGLAFARQKAIDTATSDWVGFLDDDNLPTENWVVEMIDAARSHPKAAVFGSRIHGDFEVPPPDNFYRIAPLLALSDLGSKPQLFAPKTKLLPPGAGLVVRKQAWRESVPDRLVLLGRIGGKMLAGEDLEALLYIQRAGWEIWYVPSAIVYHRIPASRLQKEYLIPLCRGIGLSRFRTRMLSVSLWQRPFALVLYALNDLRKLLRHWWTYRTQFDLAAECETQLFLYSFLSPFYLWKYGARR